MSFMRMTVGYQMISSYGRRLSTKTTADEHAGTKLKLITLLLCVTEKGREQVPKNPTWVEIDQKRLPEVPELNTSTIELLERLSLVEFNNQALVDRLTEAIKTANQLYMVNTEGVEPMDSVLEDRVLYLREDKISDGYKQKTVLSNAKKVIEDYYVAPPGNIRLKQKDRDYKNKS